MHFVRTFAFIGLVISSYLFYQKATGQITSIVGCGGTGGCAQVLGSVWSQWFGIPVSILSAFFYLTILALTFKPSRPLLTIAAYLLTGSALWFLGLQLFVIKSFCPWCFWTHMIGLATATALLIQFRTKLTPSLLATPLILIAGLALGQIFGPKPDTHEESNDDSLTARSEVDVHTAGQGRLITFKKPDGQLIKSFRLGSVPLIGSPNAPHILVKYFDYTCASCREMEDDLDALLQRYPADIAVIVLPAPLNRACNPYLKQDITDHPHACELARLALAAWKAQPESFLEVHHTLFQRPIHSERSARQALLKIIPAAKLDAALQDPWVEKSLQANLLDYRLLAARSPVMPKLMVTGQKQFQGLSKSTDAFVELISGALDLK